MAFMLLLYWGPWRGSAPYLWVEQGGIVEPGDMLPSELQKALRKPLEAGLSHVGDWTVLAFADGSAFLASVRLAQATMAELAAKHFSAPWRRLTERRVA